MASNHTRFASLAMSPDGTRIESKLKDFKRQVRSRVKQIKQLEATINKLKSKSHEVKTKIPLEMVNQALYKAFLARS
jgi:peptidoglycan hydrolase CwlO-like protein